MCIVLEYEIFRVIKRSDCFNKILSMVTLLLKLVSHHRCMVEIDNRRRFERCLKQLEQLVGETKVEVTETRTAVVNSRLSTTLFACNLSTERHMEKILGTYRTFTFYELRS